MVVPVIPKQREFRSNAAKPFNDLIKYLEGVPEQEQQQAVQEALDTGVIDVFNDVIDYAMDSSAHGDKCMGVRTHGVNSRDTAAIEMNAVSRKNTRCKDPVYHFILSWPEHERPEPSAIFDAAEHAIKALGLGEHQYVIAVHDNTDNRHCHIAVNRVHPLTFKSHNIEWAKKTLHYAAREIEIKHGWAHDNGIYIVRVDGHGRKQIVLNPEHANAIDGPHNPAREDAQKDALLPTWHDPQSLESWLKSAVAKALKSDLPDLGSWHALHVWLGARGVTLTDSGGGGLRLQATSTETGEILDLAASKGLRLLKRAELEKRWGPFAGLIPIPVSTTDLSHLTPQQILEGTEHVIHNTLDGGVPPPDHILRAEEPEEGTLARESRHVHDVPDGGLASQWGGAVLPLQGALSPSLGDQQTGKDLGLRRTGDAQSTSREGRLQRGQLDMHGNVEGAIEGNRLDASTPRTRERQLRNYELREQRRLQRAAQRKDLRQRYNHYRRLVRSGDSEYFMKVRALREARRDANKALKVAAKGAKSGVPKSLDRETRLLSFLQIDAATLQKKSEHEASYQGQFTTLRSQRVSPLSWRTWLTKQASLGDQAALSALRGIVYQARRDAKRVLPVLLDVEPSSPEFRERQFEAIMDCLLEEERQELAIRSASVHSMRPHEVDALLIRHAGMNWKVTGNGNVEYADVDGGHLYTDRGNRITFDRVHVTDEEIRLALLHAQSKFGNQLTLTGTDPDFARRMACIADDMGMIVLNPELQATLHQHRQTRQQASVQLPTPMVGKESAVVDLQPKTVAQDIPEQLRARVLSIDPNATFVEVDASVDGLYVGQVVSSFNNELGAAFAQHAGRSVYLIHNFATPLDHDDQVVEVRYSKGSTNTRSSQKGSGQERG